MSHDISIVNGQAEAAFAVTPAWHGLGEVVDHAMTSEEALELAHLNWLVLTEPIHRSVYDVDTDKVSYPEVPGHVLNIRSDTGDVLGMVTEKYQIVQNREAFAFLDALHQDGIVKYESAFALRGGRQVVIVARMPQEWTVKDGDTLQPYIMFSTSHDGREGIRIGPTVIRPVCQNTYRAAITAGGIGTLTLRHTGGIMEQLRHARAILNAAGVIFESYVENARVMSNRIMTCGEWVEFLDIIAPVPSKNHPDYTEAREAAINKTRAQIHHNYHEDPKQRIDGIGETAWAAYNAVTQLVDHTPRRGKNDRARSEARFRVTQFGTGQSIKTRAYRTACRIAGLEDVEVTDAMLASAAKVS